jgi:hypothetical protein
LELRLILASATALACIIAGSGMARADPPAASPIAVFVNVASDSIADKTGADGPKQFVFHGIPLTFSAAHQVADAAPGVTAGINGRHTVVFDDRFSLEANITFSKTQGAEGALLDMAQGLDALASTSFRYHLGNLAMSLAPRIDATAAMLGIGLPTYGFDSGVTDKLASDWNLSLQSSYTRQGGVAGAWGRSGSEGLAIAYLIAPEATLQIGYNYCWTLPDADLGSVSQGPSIGTSFSPAEALSLALKYSYGVTSDNLSSPIASQWFDDGSHHFDFNAAWDLAPEGISGARIGASYGIQTETAAADLPTQQSASVNLALDF